MKFILSLLLITLSSLAVLGQTENKSFPESGFSATFPKSLKVDKKNIDSDYGKIDIILYLAEGSDFMIMLSESKYPSEIITPQDKAGIKNILEGAKNGALNNFAKQMSSKYNAITNEDYLYNNKYQGIKFSGNVNEIFVSGQTFMRNRQMYQILVFGNTTSAEVVTFLKSFTLIELK